MKLELSQDIFDKSSNIKFDQNPFSESRVFPCGRTGRHDKADSHFSQFCKSALKNLTTKTKNAVFWDITDKPSAISYCYVDSKRKTFFSIYHQQKCVFNTTLYSDSDWYPLFMAETRSFPHKLQIMAGTKLLLWRLPLSTVFYRVNN